MKKYKVPESPSLQVSEPAFLQQLSVPDSMMALIELVRRGISYTSFESFAKSLPFNISEWSKFLHLSERTMARYQTDSKTFDSLQTEKILEIAMLHQKGTEVFGNSTAFNSWLSTENLALGRSTPKELLDSTFGISLIRDELGRIEHGILA